MYPMSGQASLLLLELVGCTLAFGCFFRDIITGVGVCAVELVQP